MKLVEVTATKKRGKCAKVKRADDLELLDPGDPIDNAILTLLNFNGGMHSVIIYDNENSWTKFQPK